MAKAGYFRGLIVVCALTAAVPACGGGGGGGSGGAGNPGPIATGLPLNTPPSAPLAASQTSAASLAAEIQDGAKQLAAAAATPSDLPGAAGVEETLQCSQLAAGGTGSATIDDTFSGNTPSAGAFVEITYNDCSITEDGFTESFNGTIEEEYVSYNSVSDFSIAIEAKNLTVSTSGEATETLNFSETLDVSASGETISYTAANGGSLEITSSDVITDGNDVTITGATYVYQSAAGGGVVSAVYDNWTYDTTTDVPLSGTVTITGASGAQVVITATSTGYDVEYTSSSGATSSYTVTY